MKGWLAGCIIGAVWSAAELCAQTSSPTPLTTAREVRSLTVEQAQSGLPVILSGTVGFIEAPGTVFLQDETGGTFFRTKERLGTIRPGDIVNVTGVTVPGLYLTGIDAATFQVMGHGPVPSAAKASYDDLAAGRYHYQLVEVEGIGRRLSVLDENRSLLFIAIGSRVIEARVDAPPPEDTELVDAKLRITALAAGGINDRRQMVFPYLRVAGWEEVQILKAAPQVQTLPITPAASLMRFVAGGDQVSGQRVCVAGTVLAAFDDGLVFIRDTRPIISISSGPNSPARPGGNSLGIQFVSRVEVKPGDLVEAAGFPVMAGFSAGLADAILLEPSLPKSNIKGRAEPVTIEPKDILSGVHDADLVSLSAVLTEFFRTSEGMELRLKADNVFLRAVLPLMEGGQGIPLASGMRLQVTGICRVESSTDKGFRSHPQRAALLLRGPSDLRLLQAPSWWTAPRLAWTAIALVGVIAFGILWITALRRRIARQATALRQKIAHEAVLEERQRIAREFHDTLEQELAGLSLRLDAATTRPLEEKAQALLRSSLHLVARIQTEARNLVADLRVQNEEASDLQASLCQLAKRQQVDGGPQVQLVDEGRLPKLPAHAVHHLRMIAQEAVTNALKHAQANIITLNAEVEGNTLVLRICDDGKGLDPERTHGIPGHFGCMGIRERCRKIGAEVKWKTSSSGGACVEVRYPLESGVA